MSNKIKIVGCENNVRSCNLPMSDKPKNKLEIDNVKNNTDSFNFVQPSQNSPAKQSTVVTSFFLIFL